jgi:hypothetical protein
MSSIDVFILAAATAAGLAGCAGSGSSAAPAAITRGSSSGGGASAGTGASAGSSGSSAGAGPTTILSDDFAGPLPDSNWTLVRGGALVDSSAGNPGPSLALTATSTAGAAVRTVATFDTARGVTVSVDIAPSLSYPAEASVAVIDPANGPIAGLWVDDGSFTCWGGTGLWYNPNPPLYFQQVPGIRSPAWDTYSLTIDAGGNWSWTIDGQPVANGPQPGASGSSLVLEISITDPGANGSRFDNVRIEVP